MPHTLHLGNCLDILRTMPDNSVDAVVTDPPYGLSFMGKRWDYDVPSQDIWSECLRVLKPGGHLLAFAGTRTQHRMVVRIEDAGFEIRDMIAWVYGSGFPKSHDVSKAIDKAAGAEREVVGIRTSQYTATGRNESPDYGTYNQPINERGYLEYSITAPATDAAKQWHGWGTALKPALEPITVARKPLIGTVAENVLTWGTGGLNVDGCRVKGEPRTTHSDGNYRGIDSGRTYCGAWSPGYQGNAPSGRWPANLIHDGSEEVAGLFPETKTNSVGKAHGKTIDRTQYNGQNVYGKYKATTYKDDYTDSGSAARFFYCAKASKRDRDEGCEGMEEKAAGALNLRTDSHSIANDMNTGPRANHHPTVKPTDLMRYLCRLVTPPDGTVLDPFMGSGSTGKAAVLEGFNFIGIEREAEYLEIARARITHAQEQKDSKLL